MLIEPKNGTTYGRLLLMQPYLLKYLYRGLKSSMSITKTLLSLANGWNMAH